MDFSIWPSLGGRLYRELEPAMAELLRPAPAEVGDYALPLDRAAADSLCRQLPARLSAPRVWHSELGFLNFRWDLAEHQQILARLLATGPPPPVRERGELTRPTVLAATLDRLGQQPPPAVAPVVFKAGRLADLLDRWGRAGLRYQLHRGRPDRVLKLDPDSDPYGPVEYACLRVARLRRTVPHEPNARELGLELLPLVRLLDRFGLVLHKAAYRRAPHLVTSYAERLAEEFHAFYRTTRVVDPDRPDRLAVALAVGVVLETSCHVIGVDPSERV